MKHKVLGVLGRVAKAFIFEVIATSLDIVQGFVVVIASERGETAQPVKGGEIEILSRISLTS